MPVSQNQRILDLLFSGRSMQEVINVEDVSPATIRTVAQTFSVSSQRQRIFDLLAVGHTRQDVVDLMDVTPAVVVGVAQDLTLVATGGIDPVSPPGVVTKAAVIATGLTASDIGAAAGFTPTAVKSAPYTLAVGEYVPVDASGGAVALTLPTAPADKTRVGFKITAQAATPNNVTVTRGGSDVFNKAGGSTTLTFSALNTSVILQYAASSGIWYAQSTDTPLNVASGAAKLGTDGTVGGSGGSGLTATVTSGVSLANATAQARKIERVQTTDLSGSQCWFNGPTAIEYQGVSRKRYWGEVNSVGDVIVNSRDLTSGAVVSFTLHAGYTSASPSTDHSPSNDHSSPGLAVLPNGKIIVFYALQQGGPLSYRVSTNAEDVSAFAAEQTLTAAGTALQTYPHPFVLGSTLYVVYSNGQQHAIIASTDNGATWGSPKLIYTTTPNSGMYAILSSNGSRIDLITSMHPNASNAGYASLSSMYHCYFDGTTFRGTDGTALSSYAALPTITTPNSGSADTGGIVVTSMTKVYDYATAGLCWAWDVALGADGNPVCVFASFPNAVIGDTWDGGQAAHFNDHRYQYYRWNGAAWAGGQIAGTVSGQAVASMGGRITDNVIEYQYSGGVALVQSDPTVVYLSRQVAPSMQFEIERWVTTDNGSTWTASALTVESDPQSKNIRPFTPRYPLAGSPECMWMRGTFYDYTSFSTKMVLSPHPVAHQVKRSLTFRPASAALSDTLITAAVAAGPSMLLPLAADTLDIAGSSVVGSGTDRNGYPRVVPVIFNAGRYGDRKSVAFDGSSQALRSFYQPFVVGSVRTFFGWANRANQTAGHILFGSDNSGSANTGCGLRINTGSRDVQFWANVGASAGAGSQTWASAWPGSAQWVHWALIKDEGANTVELFINGVSQGAVSYTTAWGNAGNYLMLGGRGGTSATFYSSVPADLFQGSMVAAGVFEGRLTVTQIQALAGVAPVNSRQDLRLQGLGRKSETYDLLMSNSTTGLVSLVSGTMVGTVLALKQSDGPITGLQVYSTQTGAGAGATLVKAQILDSTFHVRATSADFTSSLAASVLNLIPFTAAYYPPADGIYYAVLMMVFSGGATPQTLFGGNAGVLGPAVAGGIRPTIKQSGLVDLLSVGSAYGSIVGETHAYYLGAY